MKNKFALIGYTGFIGSNLLKFKKNIDKYNSKNISCIRNKDYKIVICAGTYSKRWWANKFPKKDKKNILLLTKNLEKIKTKKFILISTCEVYGESSRSKENNKINIYGKSSYSKNRIFLENFCKKNFHDLYIIRLPIVFGNNFSKNFIYDLLNKNNINKLNGKDSVQIYNVKNLLNDINFVLKKNIKLLNISSPPIEIGFISKKYFNIKLKKLSAYRKMNMKSLYSMNNSNYYISLRKTLKDLRLFLKKNKMKFLISNLGWNKNELPSIIKLLKLKKIKNLEFSINNLKKHNSKYKTIRDVKNFWNSKSIKLYSMQSILYKINDAFIFGTLSQQKIFYKEVVKKIKLANSLDAKILVLGSPNNKKVFDKSKKECDDLMFKFLRKISLLCKKYKVILCLEANPKIYKTEYLTKTCEAINFVKKIKSKYIKLNLDLGTVIANKEKLNLIIKKNLKLIGHVQISSPYLKNLIDYKLKIKKLVYYLNIYNYKKKISIEMLAEKKNNVEEIKKIFKIIEQVK